MAGAIVHHPPAAPRGHVVVVDDAALVAHQRQQRTAARLTAPSAAARPAPRPRAARSGPRRRPRRRGRGGGAAGAAAAGAVAAPGGGCAEPGGGGGAPGARRRGRRRRGRPGTAAAPRRIPAQVLAAVGAEVALLGVLRAALALPQRSSAPSARLRGAFTRKRYGTLTGFICSIDTRDRGLLLLRDRLVAVDDESGGLPAVRLGTCVPRTLPPSSTRSGRSGTRSAAPAPAPRRCPGGGPARPRCARARAGAPRATTRRARPRARRPAAPARPAARVGVEVRRQRVEHAHDRVEERLQRADEAHPEVVLLVDRRQPGRR